MKLRIPLISARNATTSGRSIAYAGEVGELSSFTNGEKIVLLGHTVIMNLDAPPREGNNAYVPQPTRESRRRDISFASLRQLPRHLFCSVHPLVAQHIEAQHTASHMILAADAIFALAARQKRSETVLICNGYEAREQTYLDTYLFQYGQLLHISEAIINPANHPRYAVDVKQQLDAALTEYPTARILWTAPLSPIKLGGYKIEPVGPEMYQANFPPVTHDGKTTPRSPKLPAVATVVTLACCAGVGALDVVALTQKRDAYDVLTQETAGSMPNVALEVLQARAEWQRELDAAPIEAILNPATRLLSAVASNPEWRIVSLSLTTKRGNETSTPPVIASPDMAPLTVALTIPAQPDVQATEQAQPIVAALNQQTGTNLIVKQQGIATTTDTGRLRITIDAENN